MEYILVEYNTILINRAFMGFTKNYNVYVIFLAYG